MILKDEEVDSEEENSDENTTETEGDTSSQGETEEETKTTQTVVKEDSLRVSDLDKNVTPYISEDDENYATTDEDKRGDEKTDYKVSLAGEFVANGFDDNTLRFEKGTVGLFRSDYSMENLSKESYNSGSSLFFISTKEDSSLNGEYAAFGKVVEGMDLIEKMLTLPLEEKQTDEDGNTTADNVAGTLEEGQEITKYAVGSFPVISKATVETYGVDYGMPIYMEAFDYDKYMSDLLLQYYNNQ